MTPREDNAGDAETLKDTVSKQHSDRVRDAVKITPSSSSLQLRSKAANAVHLEDARPTTATVTPVPQLERKTSNSSFASAKSSAERRLDKQSSSDRKHKEREVVNYNDKGAVAAALDTSTLGAAGSCPQVSCCEQCWI